jgi:hypothetical protein
VTGIELVPSRPLIEDAIDVRFTLAPGDRCFVEPGATVTVGDPLAERFRDTALAEVRIPTSSSDGDEPEIRPGRRWGQAGHAQFGRRARRPVEGELLYAWRDGWRVASGEHGDPLDAPIGGIVRDAEPGVRIVLRSTGRALRGVVALGGASRGRLQLATGPSGALRAGGLDVGLAGTILVVGSRVDAETLTRARAMGVRGVVVAGLPSKERRDYLASEARQRAALHRLPPFAVLVLDGAQRRPIAGPVVGLLQALAGREVAIVTDPPALVFDEPDVGPPPVPADYVRVRAGDDAGREGRWLEGLGLRRFAHGVQLEAGRVLFAEGPAVVPLGDLERFGTPPGGAQ